MQSPLGGKTVEWTISEEDLRTSSDFFQSTIAWGGIYEAVIAPDGIVLFPQKNLFYWLPKEGLEEAEDWEALVELVRAKCEVVKDFAS